MSDVSSTVKPDDDAIPVSDKFAAENADVIFQSIDNVQFRIHTTNLKACTEGLSPPEISTLDDVVHLTEEASILKILFQFIYPVPQPDIQSMEFDTVAVLAEAAEKYQVYSAMSRCRWYMSDMLPSHAVAIFGYATKHDYQDIMSKAAPLILDEPLHEIVGEISPEFVMYWLKYHDAWAKASRDILIRHRPPHLSATSAFTIADKIIGGLSSLQDLDSTFQISEDASQSDRTLAKVWRQATEAEISRIPHFRRVFSMSDDASSFQSQISSMSRAVGPITSSQFSASDADIILKSGDGVTFRIHRLNIDACVADRSHFSNFTDPQTSLVIPEDSVILEMLFRYIYPMHKPQIAFIAFSALEPLSAAAEKYKIYPAMAECNLFMRKAVTRHPSAVLAYAVKHRYLDIADQAAQLVIDQPSQNIARLLPVDSLVPWIEYYQKWSEMAIGASAKYTQLKTNRGSYNSVYLPTCLNCNRPLANETTKILLKLGEGARSLKNLEGVVNSAGAFCCGTRKQVLKQWQGEVTQDIATIPPFSTFL